jgi:hypothetical protein
VTVKVLAVPAVVPVKVTTYVPALAALTAPKVPALAPPERLKAKALLGSPATALPDVSLTTTVSTSGLPEASVELAKLAVEFAPLIVWLL